MLFGVNNAPQGSSACVEDFKTLFRMLELAQRSIELWHGLRQWAVQWTMVV